MTFTTIRCTTCTSTVPWGPHCPECGAYLEFAGEPPWCPAPEGFEPPATAADAPSADGEWAAGPEVISVRTTVLAAPAEHSAQATTAHTPRRSFAGTIGAVVVGAVVTSLIWWSVGSVLGVATGIVFLVWALVLWPRRVDPLTQVSEEEHPLTQVSEQEHPLEVVESVVVAEGVDAEPTPEVQARPPQMLDRRTVQTTRPMVTDEPQGDVPCASCERLNMSARSFCLWCGEPMSDVSLAPDTVPVLEAKTPTRAQRRQQRRGPSRSWYAPILTLTLVGALLGSVLFAVFGPGAFRVRFGMTTVYQLINQFIDPYAGGSATIDEATATSTLPGTEPKDLIGLDATAFWASEPSRQQGAGTEIVFTLADTYTINRMIILPGIQNRILDTRAVATPRTITLAFDDGSTQTSTLRIVENQSDLQQLVRFPKVTTRTVRLTIDSVYPPRNTPDDISTEVAITGLQFLTPPAPPTLFNLPTDIQPRSSLPGTVS
jgi:hypothetical protein